MTDQDRAGPRFAAYRRAVSGEVQPPGVEMVHRTVLRRQRRRTATATAAVVLVAAVALGQFALGRGAQPVPGGPTPTASATVALSASPPSPSSAESSPPSTASSSSPDPGPPPTTAPDLRSYPVVNGPELHVVALPTVALQPVDGHYRGTVTIDVYNSGRQPYTYLTLRLRLPEGVRWESPDGQPTMGGCGGSPAEWICGLNPIPAGGGRARLPFVLTADFAPSTEARNIDGFSVRVAGADVNQVEYPDATPADNRAEVRLRLNPG